MEARGLLMPVLSVDCSYKHPLKFEEPFEVELTITKFNGVSLYVSYIIRNSDTGEICVTGSSSHCFTDENLKPVRIKNAHPDIYKVFYDYMKNKE
jgi:acyl-CoA thioester hydrolase